MCTRPVVMKSVDSWGCPSVQSFPCGKCPECLKLRQDQWKLRLIEESNNWDYLYFFTLTYCEEAVPRNQYGATTACKKDIQSWLKRFRTRLDRSPYASHPGIIRNGKYFSYFICAEYAPDGFYVNRKGVRVRSTMRPHYHGLIFSNLKPDVVRGTLFNDWRIHFGFYDFKVVGFERTDKSSVANYCSKYCCKGEFASRADEIDAGDIEKAFTLCSKGIGVSYVDRCRSFHLCGHCLRSYTAFPDDVINQIMSRYHVMDGSFKYRMPRYWKDRIYRRLEFKDGKKWDSKLNKYVDIKVKRYTSKNYLSLQIQNFLRERFLEKSRSVTELWENITQSGEVPLQVDIFGSSPAAIRLRESRVRNKLASFYNSNAHKNRFLNVD